MHFRTIISLHKSNAWRKFGKNHWMVEFEIRYTRWRGYRVFREMRWMLWHQVVETKRFKVRWGYGHWPQGHWPKYRSMLCMYTWMCLDFNQVHLRNPSKAHMAVNGIWWGVWCSESMGPKSSYFPRSHWPTCKSQTGQWPDVPYDRYEVLVHRQRDGSSNGPIGVLCWFRCSLKRNSRMRRGFKTHFVSNDRLNIISNNGSP